MKTEQFEILIVAIFYLLNKFQTDPKLNLAIKIVDHLERLLEEPQVITSPKLKSDCSQMHKEWSNAVLDHQSGLPLSFPQSGLAYLH